PLETRPSARQLDQAATNACGRGRYLPCRFFLIGKCRTTNQEKCAEDAENSRGQARWENPPQRENSRKVRTATPTRQAGQTRQAADLLLTFFAARSRSP